MIYLTFNRRINSRELYDRLISAGVKVDSCIDLGDKVYYRIATEDIERAIALIIPYIPFELAAELD